ncbi:MAG: cytochrome c3 family protein [Verrucomicrobiota bacterium]
MSKLLWLIAAVLPMLLSFNFFYSLRTGGEAETQFMPGHSSHGHYQIEMQCAVCHTDEFGGVKQNACLQCHEQELEKANDSHPATKFLDPRNASRLENLDARYCISCHREHQPHETHSMGLTLPKDYCFFCHEDIADERPSHKDMPFDSCATAGCHNYHDNTALYEDFLIKHADSLPYLSEPKETPRSFYDNWAAENDTQALASLDRDAPADVAYSQNLVHDWHTTSHAQAGVNCTDCHTDPATKTWIQTPDHNSCKECHSFETESFLQGRHGMRLAQGLSPMTPAEARIPMKPSAAHSQLTCVSCHSDHSFDTQFAATQACMQCHDDSHTKNYVNSPHHKLWLEEIRGVGEPGTGVSCATCHMPRIEHAGLGELATRVQHNQNDTLRPNEKMIRTACMKCHGLGFSIDALADPTLVEQNFPHAPTTRIESIDMVKEKLERLGR